MDGVGWAAGVTVGGADGGGGVWLLMGRVGEDGVSVGLVCSRRRGL